MVVVSPALWDTRGVRSTALLPLSALYACGIRIAETLAGPPRRAPVPVVCAGGALVGGSGKTPVALALARRLRLTQPTLDVHFLARGYSGSDRGPLRVELARHDAQRVGDEALLLAGGGPTWVATRRIEGAVAASDAGAQLLVMDDGLQHHGIHRDLSFLCVDARYKTGNGRLLPAGPLREPFHKALARCEAVVAVIPSCSASPTQSVALDEARLRDELSIPSSKPIIHCTFAPERSAVSFLAGRRVLPFSGTARPQRFFATLRSLGCQVADEYPLPDHHPLSGKLLDRLHANARHHTAMLITTEKDATRLPQLERNRVHVLRMELHWAEDSVHHLDRLLGDVVRNIRVCRVC